MIPLRDHNPSVRFPIVTLGLILINVLVFFSEITSSNFEGFIRSYALIPRFVDFRNLSTLIGFFTSMFLHGGWLHIISNMWFLWIFGDNIEDKFGRIKFLAIYIFCGVVAAVAQYLINPVSNVPMLGASGAVAGVLGAYLVFFPHHQIDTLLPLFIVWTTVRISAKFMIGYWFLLQLLSGFGSLSSRASDLGGTAFFAHIGGFIAGVLIAFLFKPKANEPRPYYGYQ